jgi:CRISPR-associated protein Cas1
MLPVAVPVQIKERFSMLFIEKGQLDVIDGSFVVLDKTGVRTQIPVGGIACLLLEPGTRVSHAAVSLASRVGCLLLWVGEAAVRLYSSGQPGGARADRLLYQAKLALDDALRLKVVQKMYSIRFQEDAPKHRSVEQLRAIEASRVKKIYQLLAKQYGVEWKGRRYDPKEWESGDLINRCLSTANSCLYGVTEAAVLAAGYAPAIGFLHTGKPLSFVYDIADLVKFETAALVAFQVAAQKPANIESMVRIKCRDIFRQTKLLSKLIPLIEEVLGSAGESPPAPHAEAMPVAISEREAPKDVGHRS